MGTSIITAVATTALLVVLVLGFTTSYNSQVQLTQQSQAALRLQGERARTAMSVSGVQLQGQNLTVTLLNSGSVEIRPFSQMDLMVSYSSGAGQQTTARLTYTTALNPAVDQWTVQSVSPAPLAGTWSPGATMVIIAQLASNKSGGTGTIVISTPNGVTASAFF